MLCWFVPTSCVLIFIRSVMAFLNINAFMYLISWVKGKIWYHQKKNFWKFKKVPKNSFLKIHKGPPLSILPFSGSLRTVLVKMHFWIFKNAFYKYYEFCGYRKEGDLFEFSKKAFHKYQRCASTGRGWTFMDFQKYMMSFFTKLRIYWIKNRGAPFWICKNAFYKYYELGG